MIMFGSGIIFVCMMK